MQAANTHTCTCTHLSHAHIFELCNVIRIHTKFFTRWSENHRQFYAHDVKHAFTYLGALSHTQAQAQTCLQGVLCSTAPLGEETKHPLASLAAVSYQLTQLSCLAVAMETPSKQQQQQQPLCWSVTHSYRPLKCVLECAVFHCVCVTVEGRLCFTHLSSLYPKLMSAVRKLYVNGCSASQHKLYSVADWWWAGGGAV